MLSAPSGGGKTTIAKTLLQARDDLGYSVSATTRAPRPGEEDGVHYHFLTREVFAERVAAGEFIEQAEYGGERYGTLRAEVEKVFAQGRHVVMDIEVAGARQVRAAFPEAVLVFILPPSAVALTERLQRRKTEPPAAVALRLAHAGDELTATLEYDYVVWNDDLVAAVDRVAAIIDAEASRVRRHPSLSGLLEEMRREVEHLRSGL